MIEEHKELILNNLVSKRTKVLQEELEPIMQNIKKFCMSNNVAVLSITTVTFGIWYIFNNSIKSAFLLSRTEVVLLFFLFIVAIILHEFIHGICFACGNSQVWKSVHFGFNMKSLVPYCNCRELLSKKA